jgi:hypothetical protein
MSSTPNPTQVDPQPKLAPEVVVTRADIALAKTEPDGKAGPAAPPKAAAAASATVPALDTAVRATSADSVRVATRPSFGRRLMRGLMGMILTACIAGAAVLWQSHGDAVREIVAKWVSPLVLALSRPESPAADQPSAAPVVEASVETAAPPPSSAPQGAVGNDASEAAGRSPEAAPSPESAQLLQSMARDLADLRQDMEQMKASIAELKASQDQMAREVAKVSEQNPSPRASPPPQPVALPARKPPRMVRPAQPRAASVSPQSAAAYMPRRSEPRAVAPPPQYTVAPPPMDLSAPRPPAPLREQMP